MIKMRSVGPVSVLLVSLAVGRAHAQDQLTAARDLYASAAYEDALTVLNRMLTESRSPDDRPRIEQYRAFCLLALGRGADAERAIEALITAAPSYRPSDSETSPRVRSAFTDVRRRVLPGVVQQRYELAKRDYDQKGYAQAAEGFREVLGMLADPDVVPQAAQPPLSDIRTLASGFYELASAAAAPPPPPPAPPPAPEPVAAVAPVSVEPRTYSGLDADVVPAVAIRQSLPSFPKVGPGPVATSGVVDIVINEAGIVESLVIRSSMSPTYDRMVQNAARAWRFEPATRGGVPVKFRKVLQIEIKQ